ncbi:MAG TPA: tetratricopeptide repeat protein, partial [Verrucomicrobiae bacterium]|nr:tetratricopeptide repeat protein [Verrucomicrobiae bacterium]
RLRADADYAFRQAFALCPTSPEAVFRYVNFLMAQHRVNDAILITRSAQKLAPDYEQFSGLLSRLQSIRERQDKAAAH